MNKKVVAMIFGIILVLVLGIFIKVLIDATNDSGYEVDEDYQSITDERFDAEMNAFNTVLNDIEVQQQEKTKGNTTVIDNNTPSSSAVQSSSESENKPEPIANNEKNTSAEYKQENNIDDPKLPGNGIQEKSEPKGNEGEQLELEALAEGDVSDLANLKNNQVQANAEYVAYTGDDWIDAKINEHRDEISDQDIDSGLDISDQINTNIVYGLLEDGLTEEEEDELRNYLHSVLSDGQYQEMKYLFNKYNYLLDE